MTIIQQTLDFLSRLSENNYREWFMDNKEEYNYLRDSFADYVAELISNISLFDKSVVGLQPKDAIFRIYRDIRFSNDKTPYKTHFGAYMAKGGRKSTQGGYYLHIDPAGSFLSGGIWTPTPEMLKRLRAHVYDNFHEFSEVIDSPEIGKFKLYDTDMLKKLPPGFPSLKDAEEDIKYYMRLKHYIASSDITPKMIGSDNFTDECIKVFKAYYPLNSFLNEVATS